jgi:AcrR family transcriptional regulator
VPAVEAANRFERRKQESRSRILTAAFELFRRQGLDATTIEEICARADVAPRTFFNHFPRRDDMVRALAEERLRGLHDLLVERQATEDPQPAPALLVALFDDVAGWLETSGPTYRELVGAMLAVTGSSGLDRSGELHGALLALLKAGAARGEVTERHDPAVLADIVAGSLVAVLLSWTADETYAIRPGLHDVAAALADLLRPT